jgi:hypothetical protein
MNRRGLLLCAALVVTACGPDEVPSGSPFPLRSPGATPVAVAPTWVQVNLPVVAGTWTATGAIADLDGFVAYGSVNFLPAAWTSVDGTTWQSVALPGAGGPEGGAPTHAAATADATVLLGVGGTSQCAHPAREYIWRRVRGEAAWAAAPFAENLFCAAGIPDLAASGNAFAVSGTNGGEIPFAWWSVDGLAWHDASRGLPIDSPPAVLAATDSGFLLLGRGSRTDAEASLDGRSWHAVEAPPVPPAFNENGQGMSPSVLIETATGPLAIYESDEGWLVSAWRRQADASWVEVPLNAFEPGAHVGGATSIAGRTYLFLVRDGRAGLAASADLSAWTEIEVPPMESISALTAFAGRLVMVGWVTVNGESVSQVWTTAAP